MKTLLLTPKRRFIANRFGVGYQIPLGLVCLGGPLKDDGHEVRLIDNDLYGWSDHRLCREIRRDPPDCILIGHTGSTPAHPECVRTAEVLKRAFPGVRIVYGGVHPSYHAEFILRECRAIDVIVRGEGEETLLDLVRAWERKTPLEEVPGITWRRGEIVVRNPSRPPLQDLDAFRPGWELVDWPRYRLYGMGRSSGIQFSRGCPNACTYCGQWMFWRKWRHRSPANFVEQLETLAVKYKVKIVWLADENFAASPAAAREVLERLAAKKLGLSLNLSITARDVVRDRDLLPLYKKAGVDYVMLGIESTDDRTVAAVGKDNPFDVSRTAVRLLRENGIISLANIIYGLQEETLATLWRTYRKVACLDADILNAEYFTPLDWTVAGRKADPSQIIQPDLSKWGYRNQVMATPHLSPALLFWGIRATEALFTLRPKGLLRLFFGGDTRVRRILARALLDGFKTVLGEIAEFILDTRFSPAPEECGLQQRTRAVEA